jgi:integrase
MLKAMFNKGIQWDLLTDNPAVGVGKLREAGGRTRFLDHEEIVRLLNSATDGFRPILITALHTGMRRGEILSLKWSEVDLGNGIITVQESKSGRKRVIPVDETLHKVLYRLPSRFQKGYVFPSPVKLGKRRFDVLRQWRNVIKRAEIENVRFHDLRHTFASHLVMNAVDIKTVQELLGHASLNMTMRYTHLAPDHRMRAIKILDSAYQTDTKTDTVENSGLDQLPQVVEN